MKSEGRGQRIEILDQMRGFALLTIFLVNIPGLASVVIEDEPVINQIMKDFFSILLEDTARPLFAFMFGISLTLIYDRLRKKDLNPYPTLLRRMFLLFCAGALHGYFVWAGDILIMYAMAGFMLLCFVRLPRQWLLAASLFFWLGYTVEMDLLSFYTPYDFYLDDWLKDLLAPGIKLTGVEYLIIEFSLMVNHLGYFLFGMYAYRKGFISFITLRRKPMWLLSFLLLAVGLTGKTGIHYEINSLYLNNMHGFYPFIVTLGMVLAIILWGTSKTMMANLLMPFAAIGKMTFTNYLMQSLVFVLVFVYGGRGIFQGIGIWSEPSYFFALGIGVLLFVIQMVCSSLWLKMFYYGPFEWLWRIGTYGKIAPLRRKS